MNRNRMHRRLGMVPVNVGLALVAIAGAGLAHAGCPNVEQSVTPGGAARLTPAVFTAAGLLPASLVSVGDSSERAAIVGLWKFEMLAKSTAANTNPMPDGALIDFGTAAWHEDHTELMNSGIRNPSDGDFCQGVWRRVGPSTFVLNHLALGWTNGSYTGPTNIRERITVDASGNRYSGEFTLVASLATVTPGHEFDQTTALVTITGTVTGTRVTAD